MMTDYEPVICDPLGGSDCLSRAVYNFSCLLCASRSVTAECFHGTCADARSECGKARIPSRGYALHVTGTHFVHHSLY